MFLYILEKNFKSFFVCYLFKPREQKPLAVTEKNNKQTNKNTNIEILNFKQLDFYINNIY